MIRNLDSIKEAANAASVIGRVVDLKKQGVNLVGCCPFHAEKSPSFVVSPRKNNYVCFGCGAKGDVLKFLMDYRKLSFVEAVEELAKEVGQQVEYDSSRSETQAEYQARKAERETLRETLEKVARFFVPKPLPEHVAPWTVEVDGRTYSSKTLEHFGVGFHERSVVFKYRELEELTVPALVAAGVLKPSTKRDGHFETFAGRSIYTIHDEQGRAIAFAGRKQKDAPVESPKYINSDESPVYSKANTLYGLHQAAPHIRKADRVIVVEGYTDCLTLYDHGICNVVATCGTALTEQHARKLARYTDNVTLLLDGDAAGLAATARAVEVLAEFVNVRVALLTIDEPKPGQIIKTDPDEFCRKHGEFVLRCFLEVAADGIIWACMAHWDKTDVVAQQSALRTAGRILAKMDAVQRGLYIKKLCERGNMGSVKAELQGEIDSCLAAQTSSKVWEKNEEDSITTYGVFERGRCYFSPSGQPGVGIPLSNFVVASMTLVVGAKDSERIIEIQHKSGHSITARIDSECFTNFNQFQAWVESQGQYYFHDGGANAWGRIRRFVMDRMKTVYPITKLGWHQEGFWVWKNGITAGGKFIPVGQGGLVDHEGVYYMLTAAVNLQNTKADDGPRGRASTYFAFNELQAKPDFARFGSLMQQAYGKKAVLGLGYVMAALFRDVVHEQEDFFPMLNIFGSPGTGKNKYFEMLIALWGVGGRFFDLTNTTSKALPRLFAQTTNAVVWLDEYRSELDDEMHAILTNAYNGAGRSMAAYTGNTETNSFEVTSAVMISGEHRPTRRMALYTRCIAQETHSTEFDAETTAAYEACRDVARSGALTHVVADLLRYRSAVQEGFPDAFREQRGALKMALSGQKVEDRLVGNYAVLCAVAALLESAGFALPFRLEILQDEAYKGILHQSQIIGSEDPLSTFWRIVAYLYEQKLLQLKTDLIFDETDRVTVLQGNKGSETEERVFDKPRRLLFLRLDKAHGLYLEYFQRQNRGQGLQLGTLQHYLLTSASFLGIVKAKKFGTSALRCLVFDLDKIPVEFRQTEDTNPIM